MDYSEITLNFREGSLSIRGTEEFVDRKLEDVVNILKQNIKANIDTKTLTSSVEEVVTEKTSENNDKETLECKSRTKKYEDAGLIAYDEEKVIILRDIPGKNYADKTKNVALIMGYAINGPINAKDLVPNCEKLNCYDSKNLSTTFKNDKSGYFVRKGKGQNWTINLTIPGETRAIEVLEEMYQNANS